MHPLIEERLLDNRTLTDSKETRTVQSVVLLLLALLVLTVLVLLGVHHLQQSDPYIQSVIALDGDATRGSAIFQMNCAGCHGVQADGRVGPSLRNVSDRKSQVSLIHQVISGQTPPMPQFQPTPQEMADLLQYLETL